MSAAVFGLVAAYILLAILLLSLNLRSAWHWKVKAAAILITAAFFVLTFAAIQSMLGWPTEAKPPARFQLHAALVHEPDRRGKSQGRIYLWLSPKDQDGAIEGPPRAYALPYSRDLHEVVARARGRLEEGVPVDGGSTRQGRNDRRIGPDALQIELFDAPIDTLPPKAPADPA